MACRRLLLCLLLAVACVPARAEKPRENSWTFAFQFENDLFAGTDRYYTNGIKLTWISPQLQWFQNLPWLKRHSSMGHLVDRVVSLLPFASDPQRQRNISFSIGQKMYTPSDISQRALIPNDRPYAGWLYGSAAFHSETYRRLDTFEIEAGLTGPWSLAQQAQDLVHDVRGLPEAQGWNNQINTEPGIDLIYEWKYRLLPRTDFHGRWGVDSVVNAGAAVGNIFTHVDAGVEFRFGWNLPTDFGTALIRPASETEAPSDTRDPRYDPSGNSFGFHVFAAAEARLVARDIFLDGNTFSHSHSVRKEPLVGDFMVGASVTYRRFKLSYAQVLRTKEFRGQQGDQKFGSVTISYTY